MFCSDHLGKSLYCESITCALNLGVSGCTELYCTIKELKKQDTSFTPSVI